MKRFFRIIIILPFLLTISQMGFSQCEENIEEWFFWPAEGCRVHVKEYSKGTPLFFVSDLGLDYTYLEKHFQLDTNEFHPVFFDQPGVTRSICYDQGQFSHKKVVDILEIIQMEVEKDSIDLVCHAGGCALALHYFKENRDTVRSLHMISPPIEEADGNLLIQTKEKRRSYLKDPNHSYGAVFFPNVRKNIVDSLPEKQPISNENVYLYLGEENAAGLKNDQPYKVDVLQEIKSDQLDFLESSSFWETLRLNLIRNE